MKSFKQLRETKFVGDVIYSRKIKGVVVLIQKQGSKYHLMIDGDKLDTFRSAKQAEKTAAEFLKHYKG